MKSQSKSQDWPKSEDLKMTMPTSKNPSPSKGLAKASQSELDKILNDFRLQHDVTCSDDVAEQTEIIKAKLLELMLSCKPEPPEDFYRRHSLYRIGYQDAIDTMERNILKAFS